MATLSWLGTAVAVAQVTGWTFGGTWEADDIIRVVMGNKTLSVVAGSTTLTTVVDNVVAAINALANSTVYPEHAEVVASRSGNDLRLTARTAGNQFTATITTVEAAGGAADSQTIGSATAVTASSGPDDWGIGANWSTGSTPANTDDVFILNSRPIRNGLAQSAVTLTSLTISEQAIIGRPIVNTDSNVAPYTEYRATELAIGATTINIGTGAAISNQRCRINTGSVAGTVNIAQTGSAIDVGGAAVSLRGTNLTAVNAQAGSVDIAMEPGQVATVTDIRVANAAVRCGSGVTITNISQTGAAGSVVRRSAVTTAKVVGGTHTIEAGNTTTLNADGGLIIQKGSGTTTNTDIGGNATLDLTQCLAGHTYPNPVKLAKGSTVIDPFGRGAFDGGFVLQGCKLSDVSLDVGTDRTITVT